MNRETRDRAKAPTSMPMLNASRILPPQSVDKKKSNKLSEIIKKRKKVVEDN